MIDTINKGMLSNEYFGEDKIPDCGFGGASGFCALGVWQLKPTSTPLSNVQPPAAPASAPTPLILTAGQTVHGPLPTLAPSLRGTEIDCPLKVDGQGQLILTIGIRNCFDYFLSSVGKRLSLNSSLTSNSISPARCPILHGHMPLSSLTNISLTVMPSYSRLVK